MGVEETLHRGARKMNRLNISLRIIIIVSVLMLSSCSTVYVRDYGFYEKKEREGFEEATDNEYFEYVNSICLNEATQVYPDRSYTVFNQFWYQACMRKYGLRPE